MNGLFPACCVTIGLDAGKCYLRPVNVLLTIRTLACIYRGHSFRPVHTSGGYGYTTYQDVREAGDAATLHAYSQATQAQSS